mmetsp:Transcript_5326/g.8520  ORF Transcript_5326/g.8520 Transcript_5326/m.8520 type:complete len:90 (+) Transcript_5326:46-315(+)
MPGNTARKKWSKRDAKEKLNNKAFIDISTYEKIIREVLKSKVATNSLLVERFHITSSISKKILDILYHEKLLIQRINTAKQKLYKIRKK